MKNDSQKGKEPPEAGGWLIRKRGYYYRPNRAGYTASVAEAGRYSEAEARRELAEVEGVSIVEASAPVEPGRALTAAEIAAEIHRRAKAVPMGESVRGGGLHDASKYNVLTYAARLVEEIAGIPSTKSGS